MDKKLWLTAPIAVIALSALAALLAVTAAAKPARLALPEIRPSDPDR